MTGPVAVGASGRSAQGAWSSQRPPATFSDTGYETNRERMTFFALDLKTGER